MAGSNPEFGCLWRHFLGVTRNHRRNASVRHTEAPRRRNAVPTEMLVRVRPERVIAEFDVAAW